MFFIKKENIVDFQNRCVIALFLDLHKEVRFEKYVEKNHFLGRLNGSKSVQDIYLFNVPTIDKKKKDTGIVYKYRERKSNRDFSHFILNEDFIREYIEFHNNPYDYICNNFVEKEWEKKYGSLLKSEPVYFEQSNNSRTLFFKYKSNPSNKNDATWKDYLDDMSKAPEDFKHFMTFLGGELAFTKPDWLNDPFDCDCKVQITDAFPSMLRGAMQGTKYRGNDAISSIDERKLQEWWRNLSQEEKTRVINSFEKVTVNRKSEHIEKYKSEEAEKVLKDLYKEYEKRVPNQNKVDSLLERYCSMRDRIRDLKNEFRILSLAQNGVNPKKAVNPKKDVNPQKDVNLKKDAEKDILMWGYYGNSGQGVCLRHESTDIKRGLINSVDVKKYNADFCIYGEVSYQDDKPKFSPTSGMGVDGILEYIVKCVFTKYSIWEHENEFRFVLMGKNVKNSGAICIQSKIDHRFMGVKYEDVALYKEMNNNNKWPDNNLNVDYLTKHPTKYELIIK